ncbi:hypothetical protein [Microbulbifer sp. SAOS-129_SWC]|uniref:hypothetical protein n=1 Tax=Microbulbifer sp. SAOS-129_SWC TaxID=3145235 RepID=UPI0032166FC7
MKVITCPLIALILLLPGVAALADESRNENIQFDPGTTGASIKGSIRGYESINYKLRARSGQKMHVALKTDNGANYFNVYAPGKGPGDQAIFIGSIEGNQYTTTLPADGVYTIQVFMMRSAARRKETATFTLHVEIEPHSAGTRSRHHQRLAVKSGHHRGLSGG